jgi:hypothetical protein
MSQYYAEVMNAVIKWQQEQGEKLKADNDRLLLALITRDAPAGYQLN